MKKNLKTAILCVISIVIGVLLAVFVFPWLGSVISKWGSNEVMASLTLAGALIAFGIPFVENKLQQRETSKQRELDNACKSTVYQIDIQVDTTLPDNMVRFSAYIENVGDKSIETKISNLYIDQGIPAQVTNDRDSSDVGAKRFIFPFILEHREYIEGRPDCVLCKKCFRDNNYSYPEEIVSPTIKGHSRLLRTHIELDHLSHKSIQYINPKEKFSEDVVVQISEAGVYRVTLFVGTEGEADCSCATKQFYIPNSLSATQQSIAQNTRTRKQQQSPSPVAKSKEISREESLV